MKKAGCTMKVRILQKSKKSQQTVAAAGVMAGGG